MNVDFPPVVVLQTAIGAAERAAFAIASPQKIVWAHHAGEVFSCADPAVRTSLSVPGVVQFSGSVEFCLEGMRLTGLPRPEPVDYPEPIRFGMATKPRRGRLDSAAARVPYFAAQRRVQNNPLGSIASIEYERGSLNSAPQLAHLFGAHL